MSATIIRAPYENDVLKRKPSLVKKTDDESRLDNMKILSQNHADDIAFAHALHGKDVKTGLWSNLRTKDAEKYESSSEAYFALWGKDANDDDHENEQERASNYSTLVNSYYNLATDFYEYGWGKSFHFCRFYPGEDLACAIKRHEHFLALKTGIEPGMKVLDIGCGVGSPAREISHLTGAHIIGLNNNAYQIEKARNYAIQEDLQEKLRFLKVDTI
jgi:sterol 24-C-methyltransferase